MIGHVRDRGEGVLNDQTADLVLDLLGKLDGYGATEGTPGDEEPLVVDLFVVQGELEDGLGVELDT